MQAVSAPRACSIGLSGSRRGFPNANRQYGHDRSDRRPIFRRPSNSCNRASDDQDRTWPASKTDRPVARGMGGGDNPLRQIGGRTILARVIARLEPQCECVAINANGDPQRFASFGLPVIADSVKDFPGPLAGILAALDWAAANRPNAAWILSAPGDCPFLPRDLVARLSHALLADHAELAVAASQGQSHPVIGLWSVALRDALREALVVEGVRKVHLWTARYPLATVAWPS